MAGAGAKLFTDGSKLFAADVNGYLMDQTIMRFADAAARDAAFGGVGEPTLSEGMMCYLMDVNVIQVYDGTSWKYVANSDTPSGLVLIKTESIATGTTTKTITDAFPSDFRNFLVLGRGVTRSALGIIDVQLGGITTSVYQHLGIGMNIGSATVGGTAVTQSSISAVRCDNTTGGSFDLQIFSPNQGSRKDVMVRGMGGASLYNFQVHVASTSVATDLIISTAGGATFGAEISVYGYVR